MTVKTIRRQTAEPDFKTSVSDLLFNQQKRVPKLVVENFSHALDRHVGDLITRVVSDMLSKKPNERSTAFVQPVWKPARLAGGGITEAVRQGKIFKQKALSGVDMLSSSDAAILAGITRQALDDRRKKNQALGIEGSRRGIRYPRWQFEDSVVASIPKVLHALGKRDPWSNFLFFVEPEPLLGGETPLHALQSGKENVVIRIAGLLSAED